MSIRYYLQSNPGTPDPNDFYARISTRENLNEEQLADELAKRGGFASPALALAANACWEAILRRDVQDFGRRMRESFEAQVALVPAMSSPAIQKVLAHYRPGALGWKLSGAGGGGYLVLVTERPLEGALSLTIRRKLF